MFRSSPPEVLSKKNAVQIRSEPTGEQPCRSSITTKSLCSFIQITPMHGCAPENPQHTHKNLFPGEHLWETAPVSHKSFKRLKL